MSIYKGDNLIAGSAAAGSVPSIGLTPDTVPTEGSQHPVTSGGVYNVLLTKENVGNKVTVVDATATDDQYPSAKAVYDALEGSATAGSAAAYPRPDWANAVDISADQLYTGYTAPSDGIFICSCVAPSSGTPSIRSIAVNSVPIAKGRYRTDTEYSYGGSCCPVSKDDLIKANSKGAWGGETRYFVPYKAQ